MKKSSAGGPLAGLFSYDEVEEAVTIKVAHAPWIPQALLLQQVFLIHSLPTMYPHLIHMAVLGDRLGTDSTPIHRMKGIRFQAEKKEPLIYKGVSM
ncbi:hypothetical protein J27TS7_35150 [Paenibacillus dendritiformis]|nr:hypothetical protein J27TS7_35150 [Paenibacillus dendritiformis]